MNDLLQQTRSAIACQLYYLALNSALALPDICGALEAPDGQATRARYAAWFDKHVAPAYGGTLDGDACYRFRCSMLHQGRTQHPKAKYARLVFIEPGARGHVLHNNVVNDALNIDVRVFCEDVVHAAELWLPSAINQPQVASNMDAFVRRYPDGLPPYILGVPVIG